MPANPASEQAVQEAAREGEAFVQLSRVQPRNAIDCMAVTIQDGRTHVRAELSLTLLADSLTSGRKVTASIVRNVHDDSSLLAQRDRLAGALKGLASAVGHYQMQRRGPEEGRAEGLLNQRVEIARAALCDAGIEAK